jgi:hypothetical protein
VAGPPCVGRGYLRRSDSAESTRQRADERLIELPPWLKVPRAAVEELKSIKCEICIPSREDAAVFERVQITALDLHHILVRSTSLGTQSTQ